MNDTIHNLSHGAIAGGTVTVLATPDHTTQFVALAIQLISLLLVIFGKRNQKQP